MNRIAKTLTLIYLSYLALFPLLLVPLANHYLGHVYQQQTGRMLHYDHVDLNPFSFKASLYQASDVNPGGSQLWGVEEITVNLSLRSLLGEGLVLDELRVKSLYLHPQKNADGSWVFDDILAFRAALEKNKVPDERPTDDALPPLTIHHLDFNARHLGYSDKSRPEPFETALENISFAVNEFSTVQKKGRPYHFVARDEAGGELEWQGTFSLPGQFSEGELHLSKISLLPLWRFMQSDVNFQMHSGFVDVYGQYKFSWADVAAPRYSIEHGRVAFSDIDISPKQEHESGVALKELSINNIRIDSTKRSFYSEWVELNSFRGTVAILENGVTNFQAMLAPPKKAPTSTASAAADTNAVSEKPWQALVDVIKINDAAFAFNDFSINPDFKVRIQDFGGELAPFSTDKTAVTQVKLKGSVDGYAPVTLLGYVKPMADPLDLKLAFDFKGIELSSFAPYSGTYAGYKINSGLLTVSLNYTLAKNRVVGKNKIVINQLALGERVQSARLIDIPLRLGLALLTDEHGVIDLDVDVSGNTQNPDFSLGKIVWKALRNIFVKAVTAPFRLLANLVGGGDDFEYVNFDTGQLLLSDANKASLAKLQEALAKRPQLNLGVAGLYSEDDRQWLKKQALDAKLLEAGLSADDISSQNKKFYKKVASLYQERWPELKGDIPDSEKYQALLNAEPNPELKLQELAYGRAEVVKLYLVQDLHMDPAKVYLDKATQTEYRAAVKMLLDVK